MPAPAHTPAAHAGKKIGPLPMWAWIAIVGGIGLILYMRSKSSTAAGSATSSNTVDPNNPLGLTYGQEAAYEAAGIDPLTGQSYASEAAQAQASQLSGTTGGGGGITGGGDSGGGGTYPAPPAGTTTTTGTTTTATMPGATLVGEITDIAAALTALQGLEAALAPTPKASKPAPKLTAKGAIRAPSGPHKPTAPAGYTVKGLGNGSWEFVPNGSSKAPTGSGGVAKSPGTTSPKPKPVAHKTPAHKPPPPPPKPPPKVVHSGSKKK